MLSFKGVAKRTGIWTGMAPFLTIWDSKIPNPKSKLWVKTCESYQAHLHLSKSYRYQVTGLLHLIDAVYFKHIQENYIDTDVESCSNKDNRQIREDVQRLGLQDGLMVERSAWRLWGKDAKEQRKPQSCAPVWWLVLAIVFNKGILCQTAKESKQSYLYGMGMFGNDR